MRLTKGRPPPEEDLLPMSRVPAFLKLVDGITAREGSQAAAARRMGVGEGTIWYLRNGGTLTSRLARAILQTWKEVKNQPLVAR